MADPLPRTSGPSSALRNEGLTNRDIQEAERRKALQNLKFQELLRTIEARTSQIQSPSNFVQQGIFNAFGNNVATQSLIQGTGLAADLIFGQPQNPEEKMHDETKELLKKANETLSLMDESISTIQTITKIILDNILDSNKSLRKIVDISEQSMNSAKKMLSVESDDDKPKLLEVKECEETCPEFPDKSIGEVLDKENLRKAALEYTPFTIDAKEVSPDKFDANQDQPPEKKSFEKVGQDLVEVLDKVDIQKTAMGYTPFTIEGEINQERKSLSYDEPNQPDVSENGVFDFKRQGNSSTFEKTSDVSEQEKMLEEERYRQQLLNQKSGNNQQAVQTLNEQQTQQTGLGMLELLLGAGALSSIKSLFSGAKDLIGKVFGSLKKIVPFLTNAGKGLFRLVALINPITLKIAAIAGVVAGAMYLLKKYGPEASQADMMNSSSSEFSGMEGFDVYSDDSEPIDKDKFFDRKEPEGPGMLERLFGGDKNKPEITPVTPVNVLPPVVPANDFKGQTNKELLNDFLKSAQPVSNTNSVVAMKEAAIRSEVEKLSPKVSSGMPTSQTNVLNNTNVNNQTILPNRSLPKNNDSSFNRYMENSLK